MIPCRNKFTNPILGSFIYSFSILIIFFQLLVLKVYLFLLLLYLGNPCILFPFSISLKN
ncbi:hypothetical protein BSPA14S_I0018 (plasmid) [Borreliella spielmanii A14S]|uniref:Uncharacterized protein n=1 Tax=Borreliella spielmanii A14S TaxID=498742 RepID=C0RC97_9SPIR|nr:hypothetical protein BSPA14S_I0018 [Borreliella spielmanii A14S]